MDTPEDSRAFAADYGLPFALLTDADGAVSRVYAGITSDSNTLPGVTLIRADGRIAFRQVATAKDDRLGAAELIATIDRTLGTTGLATDDDGYAALDRAQLRVELGGGALIARDAPHGLTGTRGTGIGTVGVHVPLGRYVMFGERTEVDRDGLFAIDVLATLRAPLWSGAGAVELGLGPGYGIIAGPQATASLIPLTARRQRVDVRPRPRDPRGASMRRDRRHRRPTQRAHAAGDCARAAASSAGRCSCSDSARRSRACRSR